MTIQEAGIEYIDMGGVIALFLNAGLSITRQGISWKIRHEGRAHMIRRDGTDIIGREVVAKIYVKTSFVEEWIQTKQKAGEQALFKTKAKKEST